MRRVLALILVTSALSAAIPPETVEEQHRRNRDAPEILKVRIAGTSLLPQQVITCAERFRNPRADGSQVRSQFTGRLKVLETLRSASGLERGAVITIRYDVYDKTCPGWVGPAPLVPMTKGEVLYAFLYRVTKTDSGLIAGGHDFTVVRPKLEARR